MVLPFRCGLGALLDFATTFWPALTCIHANHGQPVKPRQCFKKDGLRNKFLKPLRET